MDNPRKQGHQNSKPLIMKSDNIKIGNWVKQKLLSPLVKCVRAIHQSPKMFDKWLTAKIAKLPEKKVRRLLVLTVSILVPSMMFAFYTAIMDIRNEPFIKMQFITAPTVPRKKTPSSIQLSNQEIEKFRACRNYLDSLRNSPDGIDTYNEIARQRPHLLDSLAYIELVYGLNKIK